MAQRITKVAVVVIVAAGVLVASAGPASADSYTTKDTTQTYTTKAGKTVSCGWFADAWRSDDRLRLSASVSSERSARSCLTTFEPRFMALWKDRSGEDQGLQVHGDSVSIDGVATNVSVRVWGYFNDCDINITSNHCEVSVDLLSHAK
ncbi:MAG: hypothetical protein JO291_12140 [Acidimicrobiia bacterium]|nr:hypothetical protein [Acidimicrobiia bacterium]